MGLVRKVKKLLSIPQNFTVGEKREKYIIDYLKKWNNKLQEDALGNLYYITKGEPLICAHMDTKQEFPDCAKIDTIKLKNGVIKGDKCIIGGDDKVGIAMAMQAWEDTQGHVSLLFTVNEERGMSGSTHFHNKYNELLRLAPYCIIPDRMGSSDLIGTKNDYCSHEFENDILQVMGQFNYKSVRGFCCDANVLSDSINCINMSCGYYGHHTENEHINIDEMEMAYWALITTVGELEIKERPLYVRPVYKNTNRDQYKYNKRGKKNKQNNQGHLWTGEPCHSCTIIGNRMHVTADTEIYNETTKEVIYLPVGKYILNDVIQNYEEDKTKEAIKEGTLMTVNSGLPFCRYGLGGNNNAGARDGEEDYPPYNTRRDY